jgi:predicted dehydrogenase
MITFFRWRDLENQTCKARLWAGRAGLFSYVVLEFQGRAPAVRFRRAKARQNLWHRPWMVLGFVPKTTGGKMAQPIKLGVVGAGLIGLRHIAAINNTPDATLVGIVDPNDLPPGAPIGAVPIYPDLTKLFEAQQLDGIILSTPTPLHLPGALLCIAQGIPVLVEKPLATTAAEAAQIADASAAAGVPVLVGHHRRHNPLIQKAAAMIHGGAIGTVRAAQSTCWFYKPDDYFDAAPWRKQLGAGPISVNLVHDVDLMRYFCGEVTSVQALAAPSLRGFDNEDVAAAVLRFESGAIGTITVSDSITAPWSWEMTSAENPAYPVTDQSCYLIGGSDGALSLPDLRLWRHEGGKSWWNPISATSMPRASADPLINQIDHFADVIRGIATPLVSAEEGLRTMQVIEGIQTAAATQSLVRIPT